VEESKEEAQPKELKLEKESFQEEEPQLEEPQLQQSEPEPVHQPAKPVAEKPLIDKAVQEQQAREQQLKKDASTFEKLLNQQKKNPPQPVKPPSNNRFQKHQRGNGQQSQEAPRGEPVHMNFSEMEALISEH